MITEKMMKMWTVTADNNDNKTQTKLVLALGQVS